jgi:hypothetical protein
MYISRCRLVAGRALGLRGPLPPVVPRQREISWPRGCQRTSTFIFSVNIEDLWMGSGPRHPFRRELRCVGGQGGSRRVTTKPDAAGVARCRGSFMSIQDFKAQECSWIPCFSSAETLNYLNLFRMGRSRQNIMSRVMPNLQADDMAQTILLGVQGAPPSATISESRIRFLTR